MMFRKVAGPPRPGGASFQAGRKRVLHAQPRAIDDSSLTNRPSKDITGRRVSADFRFNSAANGI